MAAKDKRNVGRGITLKALKKQLERGAPASIYLLVGDESLLHDEAILYLRRTLLTPEEEPFDLDLVQGDEIDPVDLAARAATVPFTAQRRLVVVRRAEGIKDPGPILGHGGTGHPGSVIVLDYSPEKKPPPGIPGTVVAVGPPSKHEQAKWAADWCRERCHEKGLSLGPEAAECLVATVGPSLSDLDNEIDKLLLFAGDGRAIAPRDVEAVVGSRPGETVYALSECVLHGQWPEAARVAEALGLVQRAWEMSLPQIGLDLLRLMKLKAALEEDEAASRDRLAKAVNAWPGWVSRWKRRARDVSWRWLWFMADVLYRADRDVKRGRIDLPRALDLVIAAAGGSAGRR